MGGSISCKPALSLCVRHEGVTKRESGTSWLLQPCPTLQLFKQYPYLMAVRCGEQVPTHGTCRPPLPPSEKTVLVSGVQGGVMGSRCIRREKRIGGQSYCLQDTLQTGALLACCTLVAQRCRATSLTLVHPSLSLSSSTEAAPEGASMPAKANCKACIALLQ
ncbi:hypothetical protein ABBQ32_013236 [Trebouxia sp. C0010 RCD-2024]